MLMSLIFLLNVESVFAYDNFILQLSNQSTSAVLYVVLFDLIIVCFLFACLYLQPLRRLLVFIWRYLRFIIIPCLPLISHQLATLSPLLWLFIWIAVMSYGIYCFEELQRYHIRLQTRLLLRPRLQSRVIPFGSTRKFHRRPHYRTQGLLSDDVKDLMGVPLIRCGTSLIESVIFLAYQLSDASTYKMQAVAVATFVKSINGGDSITLSLMDRVQEAFSDNMETQADFMDYVNAGKDSHKRFKSLCESPGMKKINKFIMYALCSGLFSKAGITLTSVGYSRIEAAAEKKNFSSSVGFLDSLLEMSLFLCSSGYQAFQGMSIEHILHSPDSYGDYYDRVEIFCQDYARYAATNLAAGVEHANLAARLSVLLKEFEGIEAVMYKLSAAEKKIVLSVRSRILLIKAQLYSQKICQSTRPSPFALLVHGESSVGKSVFTDILFAHYGHVRNLRVESEYKYVRSPTAEFWDGFDPKMWCLVIDDIAWSHTKSATPDMSVRELLHIVNNVPYVTNQASIERKGNYPFLGQLIIGTTNTKALNADANFSYPSAARRRFPFIINLIPKAQFRDVNRSLCVPSSEFGNYPNFWDITVESVAAQGAQTITTFVFETSDIGEFLAWYTNEIHKFDTKQAQAVKGTNSILNAPYCNDCELPLNFCDCKQDEPAEIAQDEDNPLANHTMTPKEIQEYYDSCDEFKRTENCLHNKTQFQFCRFCDPCEGCGEIGNCFCRGAPPGLPLMPNFCRKCRCVAAWCSCKQEYETQGLITTLTAFSLGAFLYAWFGAIFKKICFESVSYNIDIVFLVFKLRFFMWRDRQKEAMRLIGANVQKNIVKVPTIFIILAATIVAGTAARFLLSRNELQGNVIPMSKERKDYFYTEVSEITSFTGTEKSKCTTMADLSKRVESNVVYAEAHGVLHAGICRLLGVGQNYYITNNHCLPDDLQGMGVRMGVDKNGISKNIEFVVTESDVVRDVERDIALVRLMSLPPRKSIMDYFLLEHPTGFSEGLYIDRDESGVISKIDMPHISYEMARPSGMKYDLDCAVSPVNVVTAKGQCGMPLLASCGLQKGVLGIHSIGGTKNFRDFAGATIVLRPILDDMISKLGSKPISWENPVLNSLTTVRELGSLHPKSVFRYIESGVATIHGSFKGFRQTPKTMVCDTPIRNSMTKRGISTDHTKPVLSGYKPWRLAALDLCNPVSEMDNGKLRECGDAYLEHIRDNLPKGALKLLHRYDEFDAINGVEGVAFIDAIKKGTSAGAPFNESKKKHLLREFPQRGLLDPVKLAPEMSARVQNIRDSYEKGIAYKPVFTAHLKDESVSAKKAELGKTRVFCGAPFDWSVVVRELFLGHVRLIQNFKFVFECGVGTVAPSIEWTAMYEHITKYGEDRIVAGDYKAYDKRMSPGIISEAFRVLIELAKESGNFSDTELTSMMCVAQDTAYPLVDFNGDLVTFWGSNPSGHPLTVIINSIVNSLYMRYAFMECGNNVADFANNVSLMTYGDDNIMSVSEFCPSFNHSTIQMCLEELDVVYTMADKEAVSVPYIHISEASFLKRTWLWNDKESVYTAPLDESSIEKMLCVFVRSKTITAKEQISEIIKCAQREWWHYGEVVFNEKTQMLQEVIKECDLESYFVDIPLRTYEYLWEQFRECSLKTSSAL